MKSELQGAALREAIRQSIAKHLDLDNYQVFIFGSEARATSGSRSDIDIGIHGASSVPGHTLQRIREELEGLRTLRLFDVVDFSTVDESFRTVAFQHVERL